MRSNRSSARGVIFRIALTGICAALIEAVKLALAFLPNVEGVTLLTALFGYCFGWTGILSSLIFVSIEPLIYGYNTWVLSYYLYWPFVAFVFMLLGKKGVRNRVALTAIAMILTFWFGVLTSLVDVGLFTGFWDDYWNRFWIYYLRGTWFYVIQIACNTVVFPLLFRPLSELLFKIKLKFLPEAQKNTEKREKVLDKETDL